LRHFLIVKKTAKEKARSAKKEKAALKKKTKVKGREVHKKKRKSRTRKKQFRSVRILCIPLQSCIVACLN